MTCDDIREMLSTFIDGELGGRAADEVRLHIDACADCGEVERRFRTDDLLLQRALTPHRMAAETAEARVIVAVRAEPERGSVRRFPWLVSALSVAAGFLLAVIILRPAAPPTPVQGPPPRPAAARLVLALGNIDVREPGARAWKTLATGAGIPAGTEIRTSRKVKCCFVCADGSEVRLNEETQIRFAGARRCDLVRGEIWTEVAHAPERFTVRTSSAEITALGTRLDISGGEAGTRLVTLSDRARARDRSGREREVAVGQAVDIHPGESWEPGEVYDLAQITRWTVELLLLKGRDNPEFQERIENLLALIGRTKMEDLAEREIRDLGDHCCLPLTRFIQKSDCGRDRYQRVRAASLLSEIVTEPYLAQVIPLLRDPDGDVRYHASEGLRRLTGVDLGYTPEFWRTARAEEIDGACRAWGSRMERSEPATK